MSRSLGATGGFAKAGDDSLLFTAKPGVSVGLVDDHLVVVVSNGQVVDFFTISRIAFDDTVIDGT